MKRGFSSLLIVLIVCGFLVLGTEVLYFRNRTASLQAALQQDVQVSKSFQSALRHRLTATSTQAKPTQPSFEAPIANQSCINPEHYENLLKAAEIEASEKLLNAIINEARQHAAEICELYLD